MDPILTNVSYLWWIAGAAALFTTAFNRKISWLVDRKRISEMWELGGTAILCVICGGLGALVGWRAGDWGLGAASGAAGSGAAPFLMRLVTPILNRLSMQLKSRGTEVKEPPPAG
jgi:hypothetical protein